MADDSWIMGAIAAQDAYKPVDDFPAFIPASTGQLEPGNIDLHSRPVVHNPDGSISTVRTMGANIDGKEVLMPTVYGKSILNDDAAIQLYRMSGKHLGKYDTPEHADAAAQKLHEDQAREYLPKEKNPFDVSNEQSTGVGWANSIAEKLYKPREYDTTPVAKTASPLVTITEGDIDRAIDFTLNFSGGGAKVTDAPINPKVRAKAEAVTGKYPQYAEEYPGTGPPQLRAKLPDPDKPDKFLSKAAKEPVPYTTMEEALAKDAEPGFFLEKKLTPEAEKFQKDRAAIQADLDLHGYEPYFDPAKRADVDPKHYGPFRDTATEAAPKTPAKAVEWHEKYGTPAARERLQAGYEAGKGIPESDRWYFMRQLEQEYIKEYGAKEGRAAFKREFADMMAATTGGQSPYDNFLMSQYANYKAKRGERMPERAYELPFPIGGRFASGNIAQAQKYIDEGMVGFEPAANPKRYDFSSAYLGNKNAGTIDEQMFGAIVPGGTIPEWYGPATRVLREEAGKAGTDTRAFQDIGWAGLKKIKTEKAGKLFEYEGPMIDQINRSIETTHRLTGMPRAEVVRRGLIRKEIPMYGILGTAGMGGIAQQQYYNPED